MEYTVIVLMACFDSDPACQNPIRQSWTVEMGIDACFNLINEMVDEMQKQFPNISIYPDTVPCRSVDEKEV